MKHKVKKKERNVGTKTSYHRHKGVCVGWVNPFWLSKLLTFGWVKWDFVQTGAESKGERLRGWWHVENGSWARQPAVAAAPAVFGASRLLRPPQRQRRPAVPMNHFVRATTLWDAHLRSQPQFAQNLMLSANKSNLSAKTDLSANGNTFILIINESYERDIRSSIAPLLTI